jgi:hypothetical protein
MGQRRVLAGGSGNAITSRGSRGSSGRGPGVARWPRAPEWRAAAGGALAAASAAATASPNSESGPAASRAGTEPALGLAPPELLLQVFHAQRQARDLALQVVDPPVQRVDGLGRSGGGGGVHGGANIRRPPPSRKSGPPGPIRKA